MGIAPEPPAGAETGIKHRSSPRWALMVKVYIVTNLEGVAGVVHSSQVQPGSPFYEEARRLLTGEVNAAIAGALRGGATEVVVNDGMGAG